MIDVIIEQIDPLTPTVVSVIEYDTDNQIEMGLIDTCNINFVYSKYNIVGERVDSEIIFSNSDKYDDFDYEEYVGIDLDDE